MKERAFTFLIFIILSSNLMAQNVNCAGVYSYTSHFYFESLSLLPDGHFIWNQNTEFLKLSVSGNWEITSDSLILDSYPHKDKLIVSDSKDGSSLKITCYVKDISPDKFVIALKVYAPKFNRYCLPRL